MGDRERGPIETNEVEPALELPVHGASRLFSADEETSSDEEPGSSVEDAMRNCRTSINVVCPGTITTPSLASPPESSSPFSPPPPERTPPGTPLARTASRSQDFSPSQSRFHGSLRSSRRTLSVVPEVKNCASGRSSNGGLRFDHVSGGMTCSALVLTTLLYRTSFSISHGTIFYIAPYTTLNITGNVSSGLDRDIALFCDARIVHQVV